MKIKVFLEKEILEYVDAENYSVKDNIFTINFKNGLIQIPIVHIKKIEINDVELKNKNESTSKKSTKKFLHD